MNQDLQKTLWATADNLRSNMDAAEYKHIVLGLIFLKYISDTFGERKAELRAAFADSDHELYLGDDSQIPALLEDRDYYTMANVFWVPESARWEAIRNQAKQPDIGKRIDDALIAIEHCALLHLGNFHWQTLPSTVMIVTSAGDAVVIHMHYCPQIGSSTELRTR